MPGTSPDLPKKHDFWDAYSEYSPNGSTKLAEISYSNYRANFQQSSRGTHPGGSERGRTRRLGLHEGVFKWFFQNWPLRPRVRSAVYYRSKYGHVRTKRASATRGQICNFGPSLRLLKINFAFKRWRAHCLCPSSLVSNPKRRLGDKDTDLKYWLNRASTALFHFWSQKIYGVHLSETTFLWDFSL